VEAFSQAALARKRAANSVAFLSPGDRCPWHQFIQTRPRFPFQKRHRQLLLRYLLFYCGSAKRPRFGAARRHQYQDRVTRRVGHGNANRRAPSRHQIQVRVASPWRHRKIHRRPPDVCGLGGEEAVSHHELNTAGCSARSHSNPKTHAPSRACHRRETRRELANIWAPHHIVRAAARSTSAEHRYKSGPPHRGGAPTMHK
jgi:hypothetical protein